MIIIIPTHNRQAYFGRLIEYYKNWSVKVFLMDSTPIKYSSPLPDNFIYHHCSGLTLTGKVLKATELSLDPCMALCADDDLLLSSMVNECEAHVKDKKFGICTGTIGKFVHTEFGLKYYLPNTPLNEFSYEKGFEGEVFLGNYSQILWSVYSRECLQYIFNLIEQIKPANANYIEVLIALVGQYKFGIKVVPGCYLIREISPILSWGHTVIPLNLDKSVDSILERERIEKALSEYMPARDVQKGFSQYFISSSESYGLYRFLVYRILSQIPGLYWHRKRELNNYYTVDWEV